MLKIFRKAIGGGSGGSNNNSSSTHSSNVAATPLTPALSTSSSLNQAISNGNTNGCNTLNISHQNVNYNHNHINTTSRRDMKAVQQAAAVAAAAAAVNAHSTSASNNVDCTNLSGSSLEISTGHSTTNSNSSSSNSGTLQNGHFHRQHYHMNIIRSKSPPVIQSSSSAGVSSIQQQQSLSSTPIPQTITTNSTNSLSNITQSQHTPTSTNNTSTANLKLQQQQQQYQFQQQQNVAVATATAAAEYYEQQLKLTQHKHLELDQQFRANLEQLKELKDTVNNLNEMNRKLYEENHQYKDRNIEQRQQIEHYHVLFQENQQKNEQSLNVLRKERDEAYQHENDLKRRMQQTLDAKHQENYALVASLNNKLEDLKTNEVHLCDELNKAKSELQQERNKNDLLDKKNKLLEKDAGLLKESWNIEKNELKQKITNLEQQIDTIKNQNLNEKQKLEDLSLHERNDLKNQLNNLECKLEEVIKEKAQLACKCGQLAESNRELNLMVQNKEAVHEQTLEETKNKLEFYMSKCNDLEKEIAESQENHARDTDEWKKFQADLQTAVRVANDFMTEAEEKMNKMREEHLKSTENQNKFIDEIDKLKKKLSAYENSTSNKKHHNSTSSLNHSISNSKQQNKENHDLLSTSATNTSSSSSLVRNLIDTIESTSNIILTSITNDSNEITQNSNTNLKALSTKYSSTINNSNFVHSTDTDDAKIISSRVRSNSSTNESSSASSPSSSLSNHSNYSQNNNNKTCVEYLILNPNKQQSSTTTTTQITDSNGYNYSIYSTLPFSSNNKTNNNINNIKDDTNLTPLLTNTNCNSDALANLVKQYGVSKRNALMKWCQERLSMYKGIEIKNFSSSWNDGLAFCALMHSYMPSKIDYETLRVENNPRKNFQTAFKSAQSVGIQQTLNIHELLNHERPDWNAVMNYVTLIYKHFQQSQTTESSSEIINNVVPSSTKNSKSTSYSSSKSTRSSSSSPIILRNTIQALPLSLSVSSNSSNSSSSNSSASNASSAFTSASSSSSSISKTIC